MELRKQPKQQREKQQSLSEVCESLSISLATGRNWLRLGKLSAKYEIDGTPYFSQDDVTQLQEELWKGENQSLKSRRNKKYVSGHGLYHSYVSRDCHMAERAASLLQKMEELDVQPEKTLLESLLADCALKLLRHRKHLTGCSSGQILRDFISGTCSVQPYDCLVSDLLSNQEQTMQWLEQYPQLFSVSYEYEQQEDLLGLLYLSCQNRGNRKAAGVYYTPARIVRRLILKLVEHNCSLEGMRICDPCCGTGNFLLQLPKTCELEQIYGMDLDSLSVKLARLNLALRYEPDEVGILYEHLIEQDFLMNMENEYYDWIIGNPPWGYCFTEKQIDFLRRHYETASTGTIESYDVFLEKAMRCLKKDGVLSFVLPEAVCSVRTHQTIREIIAKQCRVQYVELLGNAFDQVQCPCLILQMEKTGRPVSCTGMQVQEEQSHFQVMREQVLEPDGFQFRMTDDEYQLVERLSHLRQAVFLKNHAVFALGIVTGDNKGMLSIEQGEGEEPILTGSDLSKYRIREGSKYVKFEPEHFQQAAPAVIYRAPRKLLYRFIGRHLVFACDEKQTLSLNSCNILIPQIPGLEMKVVMAFLNSRVAQFWFEKTFHSIKILRTHLEQIPLPMASKEEQKEILLLVERLEQEKVDEEWQRLYERLEEKIELLYGLTQSDSLLIEETLT